jgi:hypothetical protein
MQRAALAAALLALTLALPLAFAAPDQVTVTVTYEVWGDYTGGYTPLDYTALGGLSLSSYALGYEVDGLANLPWTLVLAYAPNATVSALPGLVLVYEPNATVSARSYPPTGYGTLAGASLDYDPLLYGFQPQVILGNATFRLNVHVRVLQGNNTLLPDFDVPYKVNGTARVARRGEDVLEWTFSWIELLVKDPLTLEFPKEVEGCTLLNSSTVYADPRVQTDVWIYYSYGEAPTPTQQPPSQPGQQPGGAAATPSENPLERAISEAVWRFKLFLAWVLEWLARLPVLPNLLLLLLGLLLIALALYLWWRSRRFVLVIEAKG